MDVGVSSEWLTPGFGSRTAQGRTPSYPSQSILIRRKLAAGGIPEEDHDMALGMYFTPSGFTKARYDDAIEESFEAFGATLLPIMAELGSDPGQPQVAPIRNIITG